MAESSLNTKEIAPELLKTKELNEYEQKYQILSDFIWEEIRW